MLKDFCIKSGGFFAKTQRSLACSNSSAEWNISLLRFALFLKDTSSSNKLESTPFGGSATFSNDNHVDEVKLFWENEHFCGF